MASDVIASGADEPDDRKPEPQPSRTEGGGFFHIYKSGQGYWTRMGTAGAAALIAALCANFLFRQLYVGINAAGATQSTARQAALGITGAFLVIYGLIVYWLMNKPNNADFLIATDSEMKKVNWTSRKELWGSTKVVIIFMFLIALLLFEFDLIFGELFYYLHVLQTGPFPENPQLAWLRWGFWGLVAAQVAAIVLLTLKGRSDRR